MPNKDNSLKQFLELNTIFADVANNGLYLIRLPTFLLYNRYFKM